MLKRETTNRLVVFLGVFLQIIKKYSISLKFIISFKSIVTVCNNIGNNEWKQKNR